MDVNAQGDDLTLRAKRLRQVLEKALLQVTCQPVSLEAYEIKYSKVKPQGEANFGLELTLCWQGSGQRSRCLVSSTMWPTLDPGRSQFEKEAGKMPPLDFAGRPDLAGFLRTMAFLPEFATVVRFFPADPVLTGLIPATDVTMLGALLESHLPDCLQEGWKVKTLRYE